MIYKPIDVSKSLRALAARLCDEESIVLAGSAVPILAGREFRETHDIDFAFIPSPIVKTIIQRDPELNAVFDFKAAGIIGLLVDADDRVEEVPMGFTNLKVYRLSLLDWIVSKLASPKLEDVLSVQGITLKDIDWVDANFHKYAGVATDRAYRDLMWLRSEIIKRDDIAEAQAKVLKASKLWCEFDRESLSAALKELEQCLNLCKKYSKVKDHVALCSIRLVHAAGSKDLSKKRLEIQELGCELARWVLALKEAMQ